MNRTKIYVTLSVVILILLMGIGMYMYLRSNQKSQVPVETVNDSPAMPQETLDRMKEADRLNSPSTYLANILPVEEVTFSMSSTVDTARKTLVFVVKPKIFSLQQVQEDVQSWLISQGLSEAQIDSLIIEYDSPIN